MSSTVSHYVINANAVGQRIDNYLFSLHKKIPRSRIYRALRTGEVRINKKRAKPTVKLMLNDIVRVPPLQSVGCGAHQRPPQSLIDLLRANILLQSDDIVIVNKPCNVPVHSGSGQPFGMIDAMRCVIPGSLYLVHRLDGPVSGCLFFARTRHALVELQAIWGTESVGKVYHACVFGQAGDVPQLIATPLPDEQGSLQAAVSRVRVIARYGQMLHLAIRIETGRKHQIRKHLSSVGLPIVGDRQYGDFARNRCFQTVTKGEMLLHAYQVCVSYQSGDELVCTAPYPEYFSRAVYSERKVNSGPSFVL